MLTKLAPYKLPVALAMTLVTVTLIALVGADTLPVALCFFLLYAVLGAVQGWLLSSLHPERRAPWFLPPALMLLVCLLPVLSGVTLGLDQALWESWLTRVNAPAICLLTWEGGYHGASGGAFDNFLLYVLPAVLVWLGVFLYNKLTSPKKKISNAE